jgi:hypothetical protein
LTAAGGPVGTTTAKILLSFSAPLNKDLKFADLDINGFGPGFPDAMNVVLMAENDDNDDNGTIEINEFSSGTTLSIEGIFLDVSNASGPVTVTVEVEAVDNNLVLLKGPNVRNVIEAVQLGVKATATSVTVRTRGTESTDPTKMATFVFQEGFSGAFKAGTELEFEVADLPDGVTVDIAAVADDDDDMLTAPRTVSVTTPKLTGDDGEDQSTELILGT